MSKARILSMNDGMARSASVMARPHRGMAGQAMARRVNGSISSIASTPCSFIMCVMASLSSALMSLKMIDWVGLRM